MSRRKPVEIAEDLATELLGPGAAVSIDREGRQFHARAWNRYGQCIHHAAALASKDNAARALAEELRQALAIKHSICTSSEAPIVASVSLDQDSSP